MSFFPRFACSCFLYNKCSSKSCMNMLTAMSHILSQYMHIKMALCKSNPTTCCLAHWFARCGPIRLQPELCWHRKRTWALALLYFALSGPVRLATATCKSLCFRSVDIIGNKTCLPIPLPIVAPYFLAAPLAFISTVLTTVVVGLTFRSAVGLEWHRITKFFT